MFVIQQFFAPRLVFLVVLKLQHILGNRRSKRREVECLLRYASVLKRMKREPLLHVISVTPVYFNCYDGCLGFIHVPCIRRPNHDGVAR